MAKTESRNSELIVNYTVNTFSGSGICSTVTWENDDLIEGMRRVFKCGPDEKILALKITESGVQAYFEREEVKP